MAVAEKEITARRSVGRPSPFTAEFKTKVVEYAQAHGTLSAAAEFKVEYRKVSRWLRVQRNGMTGPGPTRGMAKRLMQSNRFTGLPRHEKKRVLAEELLHLAGEIMDRLRSPDTKIFFSQKGDVQREIVPRPDARDMKDLMVALAVCVDKSTLLAGEATSRHEVVDVAELEKALNEAIKDPEKRKALALKVLGGMPSANPGPAAKQLTGMPEHTRVRVPGKNAARRVAREVQ